MRVSAVKRGVLNDVVTINDCKCEHVAKTCRVLRKTTAKYVAVSEVFVSYSSYTVYKASQALVS